MLLFLLGFYVCGIVLLTPPIGFMLCLSGKNDNIWKIFVYPFIWPLVVYWVYKGII